MNEHFESHEGEAEHESGGFQEGQKVWIIASDGSERPAVYVGPADRASWLGSTPGAYVVYEDDGSGAEVPIELIVPRDE